jgi:hypothetical protein
MKATVQKRIALEKIPSASGIEYMNHNFFIIGDNSPWLFELDANFQLNRQYEIFSTNDLENNVIPKPKKHDFEAMTSIKWSGDSALFLFGSGSKSPERNSGLLIRFNLQFNAVNYDLTNLYTQIKEKAKLKDEELNLEAAALLNETIYLFNRGENKLISIKQRDLEEYLTGANSSIKIKVTTIDLPEINGIKAGFSGATADPKNNRLVFTASVENTDNWINDGAVLGSFIGYIEIEKLHPHYKPKNCLITEKENTLEIKVESIELLSSDKKEFKCVVVTDSDGGSSELLQLDVTL